MFCIDWFVRLLRGGKEGSAKGEELFYAERPSLPKTVGMWVAALPIGISLLIWVPPGEIGGKVGATIVATVLFLVAGGATVIPFVRHREISLSPEGLYLRLGPFEDNISRYDTISIGVVEKPEDLWGAAWGPWIHGFRTLLLPLGVVTTSEARWYVFGNTSMFFKVRRKSGLPVCLSVADPHKFREGLAKIQLTVLS